MPWEHLTVPYSRATFLGVFGAVECRLGLLAVWPYGSLSQQQ